ncbi:hypothetical protein [Pseudoduganella lutea]|uniref:PEP-CTERM sorting domain-containing protein n=1 Tax=Pseudoduganella lutea TaxID=321985 RepID=A0A4V0Z3N7_9BURK|nr:hypothetical protein [Pseudoduganella lutea]QBE64083.1 hypothetical protein EWM63_14760 [Pseudoduganella lutea]
MINIKKYFVIASLAFGVNATASAAVEVAGSLAQTSVLAPGATSTEASVGQGVAAPAAKTADKAEPVLTETSSWSMLLVGAGVLLLPRKRRVDNLVR